MHIHIHIHHTLIHILIHHNSRVSAGGPLVQCLDQRSRLCRAGAQHINTTIIIIVIIIITTISIIQIMISIVSIVLFIDLTNNS